MMTIFSNHLLKFFLSSLICLQIFPPLANAGFAELTSKSNEVKSGRAVINIDSHWKFHKGGQGTGEHFSALKYNDSNWERVSLPHTWNAADGTDGGNDYYRGDGWYRKELIIPKDFSRKAVFLKFEAANKQAEVFVNGKSIYTHTGGYTSFTVDLTNIVNYGQMNLIAVRVNNERDDAIPLSGDYTFYGGIYRGVKLLVMDKTHVDVGDAGSNGVYIHIPNKESIKTKAEVTVNVPVKIQQSESKKDLKVMATIKDAAGKKVTSAELKPGAHSKHQHRTIYSGSMKVNHPHLWNGTRDPYLYTVEATVASKGKVIDQVTEKAGFRYYTIDHNKGFFLNGKKYPLHGTAIHQDRKGYGSAVPDPLREEDFRLMEEMGVNALRTAHYPHSQFVYQQADKRGWIVWTEIPFVNEISVTTEFADNIEQQLTEMIKQYYNHPSIVTWGLQNELGAFGGYAPGSALPLDVQYQKITKLMQRLAAKAKKLDSDRMVSQAIMGVPAIHNGVAVHLTPQVAHQLDWGSDQIKKGPNLIQRFIDSSGMNYYFGWYTPNIQELNTALTNIHNNFRDALVGLSEYGAGGNPAQHQLIRPGFQWNGFKDAAGQWHPEEYQSYFYEHSYAIIEKHPELWTTFIWNMFDFGSDSRNEGGQPGINDKGLVTFDRKIKKDAFYFYKAQWNKKDPFVYITSRRFTKRPEKNTMVKVYSNLKKVTLTVNGRNYGTVRVQQPGVFVWDHVELKEGKNIVKASAKKTDGGHVTDRIQIEWQNQ